MDETNTTISPLQTTVYISHDTNIAAKLINSTTSTIGSILTQYVNSSDIGQIQTVSTDTEFSIQEQVIIGAVTVVGILAIVAVVLRILMPMFRKLKKKKEKPSEQYEGDRKISGSLPPYRLAPSIANSQSSSTSSISQYDISDSSSNQTRSTICSNDSRLKVFGNLHESTLSLPVYIPESRCGSCNSFSGGDDVSSARNLQDNLLGVLSPKSLEPLKMGDAYRHRWDVEFDPGQITPTGSLSSLSHPSESTSTKNRNNTLDPRLDSRYKIKPPSYSASLKDSNLFAVEQRPRYQSRLPPKM